MERKAIFHSIGRIVVSCWTATSRFFHNLGHFIYVSGSRTGFLCKSWHKSRKELKRIRQDELRSLAEVERLRTETSSTVSSIKARVSAAQKAAQLARREADRLIREVKECHENLDQRIQEAAENKAASAISSIRQRTTQAEEELRDARHEVHENYDTLSSMTAKFYSDFLEPLEENVEELKGRLRAWVKAPRDKTIRSVFDCWWSENYAGYLETAGDLLDRLNQFEDEEYYTVRFKAIDGNRKIHPSEWHIDSIRGLVLESSETDETFSVNKLKEILAGELEDQWGERVTADMKVCISSSNEDEWFWPYNIRFHVNRDNELLVIMMK